MLFLMLLKQNWQTCPTVSTAVVHVGRRHKPGTRKGRAENFDPKGQTPLCIVGCELSAVPEGLHAWAARTRHPPPPL